jgi:hypothetical protein
MVKKICGFDNYYISDKGEVIVADINNLRTWGWLLSER